MHEWIRARRASIARRSVFGCSFLFALAGATSRCAGTLEDPGRFADAGQSVSDAGAASNDAGMGSSAASNDAPSSSADTGASCGDVPESVFLPNCTSPGCHNAQDKEQGLDLASPDVAARLIGVPSSEGAGFLIDPAHPAQSVLYTKLTANPPFGSRMPTKGPLDDATIACVLSWIEAVVEDAGVMDGGAAAESGPTDASVAGDGQ